MHMKHKTIRHKIMFDGHALHRNGSQQINSSFVVVKRKCNECNVTPLSIVH